MNEDIQPESQIEMGKKRTSKDTQFKKGEIRNPKGRPAGSGIQGQLRKQLEEASPEIVTKLIENAKAGDSMAMRVIIERLLPANKPQLPAININIPDGSPLERAHAVLEATIRGEITPDQAQAIIAIQSDIAKLRESEELERRLIALEQKAIIDV
jgi:hypothetical protein